MNEPNLVMPNADEILDQVASWIERRDRETWAATDQMDLDAWLARSPAHLVAFLRSENAWSRADRLSALPTLSRDTVSSDPRRWVRIATRSAALLAIVGTFGAVAMKYSTQPAEKIFATPVGGHTILSLADGSKVELNTDTAVRISHNGAQRTVTLVRGEAFFDIKHDPAHPFVVLADRHRITDIGTKFLVRDRKDHLEVALIEGRAKIESQRAGSKIAMLDKGDVAIATENSLSVRKRSAKNLSQATAWRHGVLIFDNTTLTDAAAEFNRYNAHKLTVSDPAAARLTIVGTFHTDDVQAFAEVAEDILHLHVRTSGNETMISR